MLLSRRHFTSLALGALALPALPLPLHARERTALEVEKFFHGTTRGEGRFTSKGAGIDRALTVKTSGVFEGRDLILTQHVTYEDGIEDHAVWRLAKTGSGFDGRRTGVDGIVPVRVEDGIVSMSYVAEVPDLHGKPIRLRFEDRLTQTGPRQVRSEARVFYAGLPIGRLTITFKRHGKV